MPDDATLTIAVKVRDEATRQLGALSGRVRSVLLTPFNAVGKSLAGITKSLFGFKSLLLGGGIIAGTKTLLANLATASTERALLIEAVPRHAAVARPRTAERIASACSSAPDA